MPVSINLHFEGGQAPCVVCGAYPTFKAVLSFDDNQCIMAPRCVNCIINRMGVGTVTEPKSGPKPPTKRMKKLAQKQEREIMSDIGGRAQSGSGSKIGYKGDGRLYDQVRVEAKYTFSESFRLHRKVLNKIRAECQGKEKPAVIVDFKDVNTGRTEDRWAIIPYKEWEKMVNAASKNS